MYTLLTEVPSVIAEFYEEVVKSEATGNTVAEAYTYMDEEGAEQSGERQVAEYADVTYVEQVARPETKSTADLERVIALGKPKAVQDSFSAMVALGEQWAFFDAYTEFLADTLAVEEFNADLPVVSTDEEGVETLAEPKELPTAPVKPVAYDALAAKWSERRASQYPSLANFADAYVKAQDGDDEDMVAYVAKCLKVKLDNPKDVKDA